MIVQIHNAPGYGTDELAFNQYAAQLASHGINPYTHSMAPSFSRFNVSPDGYTYTLEPAPGQCSAQVLAQLELTVEDIAGVAAELPGRVARLRNALGPV